MFVCSFAHDPLGGCGGVEMWRCGVHIFLLIIVTLVEYFRLLGQWMHTKRLCAFTHCIRGCEVGKEIKDGKVVN